MNYVCKNWLIRKMLHVFRHDGKYFFFISVATEYYFPYGLNMFFLEIKNIFLSFKLFMLFMYELYIE